MSGAAPAGWHPDPADPTSGALRYWDGRQWTDQVRPAPAAAASYPPPPAGSGYPPFASQGQYGGPHPYGPWGNQKASLGAANRFSFIAIGVSVLYLIIAVATHFVILGILPIGMAIRAMARKEKLAPVALVFAVIALVVGIAGFAHA